MENNNKIVKIKDKVYPVKYRSAAISPKAKLFNRVYAIPSDYNNIFRKRVLIISGVGRSGTTILGKVIGSLKPTFYLFEPALMKLVPFLCVSKRLDKRTCSFLFQGLLFEDYFLQLIHGRNLNFNVQDDSYIDNYMLRADVRKRWQDLPRRKDVIDYLKKEQPLFVIKMPEFQPLYSIAQQLFSQSKFVHLIRNGNDVISSTVKEGWYTDAYMNEALVDWVETRKGGQTCNIPWYLDRESKEHFPNWNQITRAASIWRNLTKQGMAFCAKNPKCCIQLKYEDSIKSPMLFVKQFEKRFKLKSTEITMQHIRSIKKHKPISYPLVYQDIAKPEQGKFISLMKKLGYL